MMSKSVGLLLIFSIKYFIKHKEKRFYRMLRRGRTNENFFEFHNFTPIVHVIVILMVLN